MRTAKLIITTFLALQLFVTTGLCGGVCCDMAPDRKDHSVATATEDNYKPATEEKIEGGHCPMHAAKESTPQEHKQRSSNTIQRPTAAHHQNHHQAGSSSTINAHFCACSVKREEESFDALLQRSPEQRLVVQLSSSPPNQPLWLIESSPQSVSPHSFQPHSPPFSGRRLNIRI
ncbi:MAG: hypothetical protein JMDDDDMK_04157 [Acidobacteria bacterium]|nr:hypothetical protein [Acidobacteriota bacterium]